MNFSGKNLYPFYIAAAIALLFVAYYVWSGKGSLDLKTREITKSATVEKVDNSNPKKVLITCTNGETYEIDFEQKPADYNDLMFNPCGTEGIEKID